MTTENGGTPGGPVYMVVVGEGARDGKPTNYTVSELEPVEFMGLRCLKGRLSTVRSPHFMADRIAYFPVDKVLLITEFDSKAAYEEAAKRHRDAGIGGAKAE